MSLAGLALVLAMTMLNFRFGAAKGVECKLEAVMNLGNVKDGYTKFSMCQRAMSVGTDMRQEFVCPATNR